MLYILEYGRISLSFSPGSFHQIKALLPSQFTLRDFPLWHELTNDSQRRYFVGLGHMNTSIGFFGGFLHHFLNRYLIQLI